MPSTRFAPLLLLLLPLNPPPARGPVAALAVPGDSSMFVTPAWVSAHLADPSLVLLEVGTRDHYDEGHIPGAQFLNYHSIMSPHAMGSQDRKRPVADGHPTLVTELPPVPQVDSLLAALGVTADSRVVLYFGDDWVTPTARVYLTLDWAGLRGRVFVMDGGLLAWRAAGLPVTTEVPVVRPGAFHATPRSDVVVTLDWVKAHLHDPGVRILDARNREFYIDSVDAEMARGGHLPGAGNVPFDTLVDSLNRLLARPALARILASAGVRPGATVVSYCHIGQQGSLVYLVARYLGYDARLYDGSFQEWSAHPELPVEGSRDTAPGGQ